MRSAYVISSLPFSYADTPSIDTSPIMSVCITRKTHISYNCRRFVEE